MRLRTLILGLLASCAWAQQPDTSVTAPATAAPGPNPLVTLASEFFERDFFNVYAYADGVVDTNNPIVTDTGQVRNSVGTGFDIGGGINAAHAFRDGQLTFTYSGAFRDYQSTYYNSGTTQNLGLSYSKRLTRHLTMSIGVSGGILLYGGTFFGAEPSTVTPVIANPFSPETRFVGATVGLTYQQTRRLSYSVYGNFSLMRYNYPGSVGATGGGGGAGVSYRLTARDTVSAIYSHTYYTYQRAAGQDTADQFGLSWAHGFNNHWTLTLFGGEARSNAIGTIEVPVTLVIGNQAIGGYVIGRYNQTAYVPSFSGTLSHGFRRSALSLSAGEGLTGSGNGYFLASRTIYVIGVYSYSWHGQNLSFGGMANHLSSVANTVTSTYDSAGVSASYGRGLVRYVGMFLRYDYTHYGALHPYNGISDNRFAFGFNFSSRSIPLTLF